MVMESVANDEILLLSRCGGDDQELPYPATVCELRKEKFTLYVPIEYGMSRNPFCSEKKQKRSFQRTLYM